MNFENFSKNGKNLPIEQAVIPLSNIEYSYGFGVYENIRVSKGIPYFLKDHIERLEESARIIGLEHGFDEPFVEKSVADLIEKSGTGTYNLKILLIGSRAKLEASLYILPLNPHFPDRNLYKKGAPVITYKYERPFPHAKTLNMLESYLAYKKARETQAYDALLINSKGCITEGTRTNFFCIKDRTLISPPEQEILLGVTRKVVLAVAKGNGFTIEEKDIRVSDIANPDAKVAASYDGAFITSTSSKILPLRSIDSQILGDPPMNIEELMHAFDTFLSECSGVLI